MSHSPTVAPPARQPLLTRRQVAEVLAVELRHIDRLLVANELPVVRIGRSVRFKPEDVERFIEANTAPWHVGKGADNSAAWRAEKRATGDDDAP